MVTQTPAPPSPFVNAVSGWEDGATSAGPDWLLALRRAGRERFAETGLPKTTEESWRFTSLKRLAKQAVRPAEPVPAAAAADLVRENAADRDAHRLVFVNGFWAPELSSPGSDFDGVQVAALAPTWTEAGRSLRDKLGGLADPERHPFAALNAGFFGDGAHVRVPAGRDGEAPIHLLFVTRAGDEPRASHPRVILDVEAGARARVIEEHVSADAAPYFTNAVTEAWVGDNASLEHVRLQNEGEQAVHIGLVAARVGRDARFLNHSVSLGGRLVRVDIDAVLHGEGGSCSLNGLYLPRGRQHVDHHTHVDHARPRTASDELYKGVLDGKSTGVFNGRVLIREDAQQTEAAQTNNNLLLSSDAMVNTNPELEIFADDVKARHGATIGQIEDEQLFYLRSRGIERAEARKLLIRGFVGDMIERISIEPLRNALSRIVGERF